MTESENPKEKDSNQASNEDITAKPDVVNNPKSVGSGKPLRKSKKRHLDPLELAIIASCIVLCISILIGTIGVHYRKGMDMYDVWYSFLESLHQSQLSSSSNRSIGPEPGVTIADPGLIPDKPVSFTVHFNGDGLSDGIHISSADYDTLDVVIETTCMKLIKQQSDNIIKPSMCRTANGAKLYKETGVRIYSFLDVSAGKDTYIVPQGVLFVYPLKEVGHVIYPETVQSVVPGKEIKLIQLSMQPRVFSIENFMSTEEMEKIIAHNKDLVKPSEVGFSGWRDSTRTSYTAWDFHSWAAKRVHKRSFDITAMSFDRTMSDSVQVLRYNNAEWYKPHVDWFSSKGYEGNDPTVNNGTNRFATVFLYISNVDEGGETVFPLSTTHKGYNGETLVKKGTEKTAGYIADRDAKWVCNSSSTALRTTPKAGDAVLFYNQGPRGELDEYSLHGGCPVIKGTKWSANVWLWNRPKPSKSNAKPDDAKKREEYLKGNNPEENVIKIEMVNNLGKKVKVYWDDGTDAMLFQGALEPDESMPMNSYHGHIFRARDAETGETIASYRVDPKHNHDTVEFNTNPI